MYRCCPERASVLRFTAGLPCVTRIGFPYASDRCLDGNNRENKASNCPRKSSEPTPFSPRPCRVCVCVAQSENSQHHPVRCVIRKSQPLIDSHRVRYVPNPCSVLLLVQPSDICHFHCAVLAMNCACVAHVCCRLAIWP